MTVPIKNPYVGNSPPSSGASMSGFVRVGQIISFALIQGVIFITAVLLYLRLQGDEAVDAAAADDGAQAMMFLFLGIVLAFGAVTAALVVKKWLVYQALHYRTTPLENAGTGDPSLSESEARLLGADRTATLIAQAILEGGAVANAVLMFIGGSLIHLVPIAALLIGIAALTPTVGRAERLLQQSR